MVESKHQWKAWLYLSPAIILLLVFTVYPIINTLIMAFSNSYTPTATESKSPIGINNFIHLFSDENQRGRVKEKGATGEETETCHTYEQREE